MGRRSVGEDGEGDKVSAALFFNSGLTPGANLFEHRNFATKYTDFGKINTFLNNHTNEQVNIFNGDFNRRISAGMGLSLDLPPHIAWSIWLLFYLQQFPFHLFSTFASWMARVEFFFCRLMLLPGIESMSISCVSPPSRTQIQDSLPTELRYRGKCLRFNLLHNCGSSLTRQIAARSARLLEN